jgi:hypothetical protein
MAFIHRFFQSLINDENIVEYTFFENNISDIPSAFSTTRLSYGKQVSFKNLDFSPENINSTTFDIQQTDKLSRTLLHHAVIAGDAKSTLTLLQKGVPINARDKDKRSALHYAIMHYHKPIIEILIDQPEIDLNATDYLRKTPLNTAFHEDAFAEKDFNQSDYIELILSMVNRGADLLIKDLSNRTALDTIELNDSSDELFLTAVHRDLAWFQYLSKLKSPLRVINKLLKPFDLEEYHHYYNSASVVEPSPSTAIPAFTPQHSGNHLLPDDKSRLAVSMFSHITNHASNNNEESFLYHLFENLLKRQDPSVLKFLVYFYLNLELSTELHVIESNELKFIGMKVATMIDEIFHCESMEFPLNIQKILQPHTFINVNEPLLIIQAKGFEPKNLLAYCLTHQIKFVFSIPPIAHFINDLFYSSLRKESFLVYHNKLQASSSKNGENSTTYKSNDLFYEYKIMSNNLRSCPFAVFLLKLASKFLLFFLIADVTIDYWSRYGIHYSLEFRMPHYSVPEIYLLMFTFLEVVYQVGHLYEYADYQRKITKLKQKMNKSYQQNKKLTASSKHTTSMLLLTNSGQNLMKLFMLYSDQFFDLLSLFCLLTWLLLRVRSDTITVARVILSLAAIPTSLSLLPYFSLVKPMGELILILKFIMADIVVFGIVYLVFVFGFGISIFVLFHSSSLFPTSGLMFLQLFIYTLNQFDFEVFQTDSIFVNTIGIVLLMIFLSLTAIILINVLIASLTSTHQKILEKALVEWSYVKGQLVANHLLLKESNTMKIIPAPFNILPVLFLPLQFIYNCIMSFFYFVQRKIQEKLTELRRLTGRESIPTEDDSEEQQKQKEEKDSNGSDSSDSDESTKNQPLDLTESNSSRSLKRSGDPLKKKWRISITGTLANLEYSVVLGSWIRVSGLAQFYYYHLVSKWKDSTLSVSSFFFWLIVFPVSFFILCIRFIFVILTPIIHWRDCVEKIDENDQFHYMNFSPSDAEKKPPGVNSNNKPFGGPLSRGTSFTTASGKTNSTVPPRKNSNGGNPPRKSSFGSALGAAKLSMIQQVMKVAPADK